MKVVYVGLESSGKSLKLAMVVCDLAYRNHKWLVKQRKDKENLSDNAKIREYEGQTGELYVSLVHDNYNGINKIQFKGFIDRN